MNSWDYIARGHKIESPYFLAPMNTGFAVTGLPSAELIAFHGARASIDLGVAYVGNVAIEPTYTTNDRTLYFAQETAAWKKLASVIEQRGSLPGIQLACRIADNLPDRKWGVLDKLATLRRCQRELSGINGAILKEVVASFAKSARVAAACGFVVVQVHAAHGYLVSNSLNSSVNVRTDEFGDRFHLLREILVAIRDAAPQVAVDVRLSISDFLLKNGSLDFDAVERVVSMCPDIVSFSSGSYELARGLIYPSRHDGPNVYVSLAKSCAELWPDNLWNVAGNIRSIPPGEGLPDNLTYSIGRPLLADPNFVSKHLRGLDPPRECLWTGHCHYYTRGKPNIECPQSEDLPSQLTSER